MKHPKVKKGKIRDRTIKKDKYKNGEDSLGTSTPSLTVVFSVR